METTTNNTYQLLPAAQRAMQKEYGNDVAYILISEGCNCIADVTAEQLEQAMERADRETRDFGAQTLVVDATDATMEGEPISICTEEYTSDFSDTHSEVCPKTPEEKNDTLSNVCRFSENDTEENTDTDLEVCPKTPEEKNDTLSNVCRFSENDTEEKTDTDLEVCPKTPEEKNDTHSEVCRISEDEQPFELVIDNTECVNIANTLHGRIKANVQLVRSIYAKTLSAAVANGFVLHEMKRSNPRSFSKHFRENGDMTFDIRTAQRYMKLACYTLEQAIASGQVLVLQQELSTFLHNSSTTPTILLLGELLGAETLRQAMIECGAIPQPKKLTNKEEEIAEQLSNIRSEAELEEEAWMEATRMVSNFKTYMQSDIVKLNPSKREALQAELENLLEELKKIPTETITI